MRVITGKIKSQDVASAVPSTAAFVNVGDSSQHDILKNGKPFAWSTAAVSTAVITAAKGPRPDTLVLTYVGPPVQFPLADLDFTVDVN